MFDDEHRTDGTTGALRSNQMCTMAAAGYTGSRRARVTVRGTDGDAICRRFPKIGKRYPRREKRYFYIIFVSIIIVIIIVIIIIVC